MPGRLAGGQLEVSGAVGGLTAPTVGGVHVGYALNEQVQLEAGTNLSLLASSPNWATGWAGVRLTRQSPSRHGLRLVADVELGAGAGVGGASADRSDDHWTRMPAAGIYEGFGLGAHWRWLGFFVRGRLDAAAGEGVPTTLWPTLMAGLEVRPLRWFSIGAGGGYLGHWTRPTGLVSLWFYQAQLTLLFDLQR